MKAILAALILAPLLALAAVIGPSPATAQAQCAGLADVLARLSTRWQESALWTGARDDGRSVTITVAPDGGTWTVLLVDPSGTACLVASGSSWKVPSLPKPGQEG